MPPPRPGDGRVRRHFLRDIDCTQLLLSADRAALIAPLTDAVRSVRGGGAPVGLLTTLLDVGASDPAMAQCPADWVATQTVSVHGVSPLTAGPIIVESRLERLGKKLVVLAGTIWDGHGVDDPWEVAELLDRAGRGETGVPLTLAATGTISFARMTREAAPHMADYRPADWIGQVRTSPLVTTGPDTVLERMGIRVVDPATGAVEIDSTPYVVNSIGTVNGGSQAAVVEVAAEALRPGSVAVDLQMHFLSQVRVGPARSSASLVRDGGDHSVVSVRLVDAGQSDQLVALATVVLQPTP